MDGRIFPTDDITKKSGFSGAIGAYNSYLLSCLNGEGYMLHNLAVKGYAVVFCMQHGLVFSGTFGVKLDVRLLMSQRGLGFARFRRSRGTLAWGFFRGWRCQWLWRCF